MKKSICYYTLLSLLTITPGILSAQQKIKPPELLLIGTFHFNNPGADAVKFKTMDVLTAPIQKQLELMTDKIAAYSPSKIYVEWDYRKQAGLDSLYQLYLSGTYSAYVESKYKNTSSYGFYTQNEIIQLAFRAGKKAGLKKIYAIDYELDLPADTVFGAITAAGQNELMAHIETAMKEIGSSYDRKMQRMTLTEMMIDMNTLEDRRRNVGFYIQLFNRAGKENNFSGALCVSEWYRRNLYMYSLIQKKTEASDRKVMVLLGAGHTAMMQTFIEAENEFKITELKDVLK